MSVFDEDKRDLVTCQVKNFNLHEDLAQLDYMFCDKTGTLTQNELIFKAFKIIADNEQDRDQKRSRNTGGTTKADITNNESTMARISATPQTTPSKFLVQASLGL